MAVFGGAVGALAVMTVLSAALGFALPSILPKTYTHYASAVRSWGGDGLVFVVVGVMVVGYSSMLLCGKGGSDIVRGGGGRGGWRGGGVGRVLAVVVVVRLVTCSLSDPLSFFLTPSFPFPLAFSFSPSPSSFSPSYYRRLPLARASRPLPPTPLSLALYFFLRSLCPL